MASCTFFGHRTVRNGYTNSLIQQIELLICNCGVDTFYVGNQGDFDHMALCALRKIQRKYPGIHYFVVLAYMPGKKKKGREEYEECIQEHETIYLDGIEKVPRRFAISYRNKWMVLRSEYIISCVYFSSGGAAQFVNFAKNKGKKIISLADLSE